jgi:chromosome segregation ATPase
MREKINELIDKANELSALLVLGQKAIPFLEEIFIFINEIEPVLEEINQSISDNLKKMPSATNQISKVTEATELATTEILDIMDNLSNMTREIKEILNNHKSIVNIQSKYRNELLASIRNLENIDKQNTILAEIENTFYMMDAETAKEIQNTNNKIENILQTIEDDSLKVVLNLQVQDISSQQLAAVNHLIVTVQEKLFNIIKQFDDYQISDLELSNISNSAKNIKEGTFDPDAIESYSDTTEKQSAIDEIIKSHKSKESDYLQEKNSVQEDIDRLFSNQNDLKDIDNQ